MPEHIKVKRIFLSKKKGVKNQPRCEITEGSLIINRLGAGHNGGGRTKSDDANKGGEKNFRLDQFFQCS